MLLLPLFIACQTPTDSDQPVADPPTDCDPLDPALCALPYPSDFFTVEAETPTGLQVAFSDNTLPGNVDGVPMLPTYFNEKDGFSIAGAMLTWFEDVSLEGVVSHTDLAGHLADDVKTVLINTTTGQRVPHWVETDTAIEREAERLLILRPSEILDYNTRYVVGMRGLEKTSGGSVNISPAFSALRDGSTHALLSADRQSHFDSEVFPLLADAGFIRDDIQLAWDFTTVSRDTSLSRVEWLRDDLYDRIGTNPPYAIEDVEDFDCDAGGHIARKITGTLTVPLYTQTDEPGTRLTRDDNNQPFYNGDTNPEFWLQIPCSVAANPAPSPTLQFGHGFFGELDESEDGWVKQVADEAGWLILAVNWTGMSYKDRSEVMLMFSEDPTNFAMVPERTMQGYVEALAATRLVMGDFAKDPAVAFDGVSVVDVNTRYFSGTSLGSILGGGFLGLSPDFERAHLGVGGASFSMLAVRSTNFTPFFFLLTQKYDDGREITLLAPLVQMLWDPAETAGWAKEIDERVLQQNGVYDTQVNSLGAHLVARSLGSKLLAPAYRDIYGLEEVDAPVEGNVLVEWHYTNTPDEPVDPGFLDDAYNTHHCPRNQPEAQAQLIEFLSTGIVQQTCQGVCEDVCDR
jgi:hypothetical protein